MNQTLQRWLEIVFILIALYLVLSNALGFSMIASGLGKVQVETIKVLQGR